MIAELEGNIICGVFFSGATIHLGLSPPHC
jgi:hypothetical protein